MPASLANSDLGFFRIACIASKPPIFRIKLIVDASVALLVTITGVSPGFSVIVYRAIRPFPSSNSSKFVILFCSARSFVISGLILSFLCILIISSLISSAGCVVPNDLNRVVFVVALTASRYFLRSSLNILYAALTYGSSRLNMFFTACHALFHHLDSRSLMSLSLALLTITFAIASSIRSSSVYSDIVAPYALTTSAYSGVLNILERIELYKGLPVSFKAFT